MWKHYEEIHRVWDDEGPIVVGQYGDRRILTFGNAVEQSCVCMADPARLEYIYTQAMMLGLLLSPGPKDALLLGLGGGSLARALHAVRPACRIHAVEKRLAVVDIARQYFLLPDTGKLRVTISDANTFVSDSAIAQDLVFADLYRSEGMDAIQISADFLAACRDRLKDTGVFIANHWCGDFNDSHDARNTLLEVFSGRVLQVHVQGGNIIAFAFKQGLPNLKRNTFYDDAQALGNQLNIPLQKLARNFWRQNAEALQLGRFKGRN